MKNVQTILEEPQNKKLLVIFPHPDDETVMASGLMMAALGAGWQVKVVCVTNGTLGRVNVHGRGRSVVQIRREELGAAMEVLGVKDYQMWRHCDGKLKDEDRWREDVVGLLEDYKPGVVVSYGPSGISGHPDHLALGKLVAEWVGGNRETRLLWPAFAGKPREFLESKVLTAERLETPEYELGLDDKLEKAKRKSLLAHESQDLAHPLEWLAEKREWFEDAKYGKEVDYSYVEFDLGD